MARARKMVTWPLSLRDHDLARPVVRVRSIFVIPFRQPPHGSTASARVRDPEEKPTVEEAPAGAALVGATIPRCRTKAPEHIG